MADIKASENAVARGDPPGAVDASIAQPSIGEVAAQPAAGVTSNEPAQLETKTEVNKITKPAAKTDQKTGTSGSLLRKLMFWKKDKKAQA